MRILHLYPNLMNMYGDYGNITVLSKHLIDQGIKVSIDKKDIEDKIDFSKYDFIYMGSGSESNLMIALANIIKYKKDILNCVKNNKVILFTGNAMELLGNKVNGKKGLGVFEFESEFVDKRYTGDVIVNNDDIGEVVGFINKSSNIIGNSNLFKYVFIDNNLKENKYEGNVINNTYGTHIIGPILVKNPNFMKHIVKLLLPKNKKYKDIDYKYELDSYNVTLNALKGRM